MNRLNHRYNRDRRIIFCLVPVFIFCSLRSFSQVIYAGADTGQYIHYFDIADASINSGSSYSIDIDQNGSDDLKFSCFGYTYHIGYEDHASVEALSGTLICTDTIDSDLASRYSFGQIIGENCTWSPAFSTLRSHYYWITSGESYSGLWDGDGYLGFMTVNAFDTIIGWINLYVYGSGTYIKIYDYAFYSVHLSTGGPDKSQLNLEYNSLVTSRLIVTSGIQDGQILSYQCLNAIGQIICEGLVSRDQNEILLNSVPKGIYYCHLIDKSDAGNRSTIKFLKY